MAHARLKKAPGHRPVSRRSTPAGVDIDQPMLPNTAPSTSTSRVTPQNRYFAMG